MHMDMHKYIGRGGVLALLDFFFLPVVMFYGRSLLADL